MRRGCVSYGECSPCLGPNESCYGCGVPRGRGFRNKGTGMSLQFRSILAGGFFLLLGPLAFGADPVGPAAPGYKVLNPPAMWGSKKKEDIAATRPILDNVKRIIGGGSLDGFEGSFEKYFSLVLFPQWTQTTEKNLEELPKARDTFIKSLEASAKNPAAHALLLDVTHRELSKIVKDDGFHPAVRYNAILIIGLLNETEPNRATGTKQMPVPYVPALSTLVEELKKPGNNEAVRVGALLGVSRHVEWDNFKEPKMQAPVRKEIIDELNSIVNTNVPPAGRSAEGQTWLRRRALEALGHANALNVDPGFTSLLDTIIKEDNEPISLRCTAAEVMSHLDFKAAPPPVIPMAKDLGYLALYACHTELLRLEGLKKKDEELLKVSGGAAGGPGGMLGMPGGGGGMMPGGMPGGGATPGGGPPSGMMQGGGAIPGGGAMPGGMAPGMPGMPGMTGGRKGAAGAGGMPGMFGTKDTVVDPKAYRVDYSKRRLRAELYAVQLALGPKKKDPAVKGLIAYATAEPDTKALQDIRKHVEDVILIVEEVSHNAEAYEKALRKEMKKLEGLTHALPVAAKADAAKAEAAKGPAAPGEEVPVGAKPAAAKPAGEEPMEEIPMAAPAKGPAEPAKAGAPAAAGKAAPAEAGKGPPAAPADAGKGAAPPAVPAAGK